MEGILGDGEEELCRGGRNGRGENLRKGVV